jgi:hypothetical protein
MPLYQYRTQDRETTFLFIHVPKTGGTAIETHLRSIGLTGYFDPPTYMPVRPYLKVPPAHYDYGYLNRLFDLTRLYSFAVVRHPVKRMISEYKWALEVSTLKGPLAQMDFSGFIRRSFEEYRRDENVLSGHFKPQVRFVGEKVTKIFKYEAGLDNVVRHVLRDVGLTFSSEMKIPVVNSTSSRKVVPSDSDIDLIREVYAEDFKAFGYEPMPTEVVSQS